MLYFKRRSDFKTYKQAEAIKYDITIDSYDAGSSQITVKRKAVGPEDVGQWLIIDGRIFLIDSVQPNDDDTTITIVPPQKILDRMDAVYDKDNLPTSNGEVIARMLNELKTTDDLTFQMPYLVIDNQFTADKYEPPVDYDDPEDLAKYTVFSAWDYLMDRRDEDGMWIDVRFTNTELHMTVVNESPASHNVVIGDGHNILVSLSYGDEDTVSKLTTYLVDGNDKDVTSIGGTDYGTNAVDWYLCWDGSHQREEPDIRLPGIWTKTVITVDDDYTNEEYEEEVDDAFGKDAGAFKIEFTSDTLYNVGDHITFRIDGSIAYGRITSVGYSDDTRFYKYESGDLRVTLSDKLKKG